MNGRLVTALSAFTLLGVIAALTLHGKMLGVVLLVLVWFAFRSFIADRQRILREAEAPESSATPSTSPLGDGSSRIETPSDDSHPGMERA